VSTAVTTPTTLVDIDLIDASDNVRSIDQEHVEGLARSIKLLGIIDPLPMVQTGDRFKLVGGDHRLLAARKLGQTEVPATFRSADGASADGAAENIVRKGLTPLEEARAVQAMIEEGFTPDGTAEALGWSKAKVTARARILTLPETAQQLLGDGRLPVSTVSVLTAIAEVSIGLCEAIVDLIATGGVQGGQLASNPGWVVGQAVRSAKTFAAYLQVLRPDEADELRLGKKCDQARAEAEALHRKLDRQAYGPPAIRFNETDIDQARAAGVLIEFDHGAPIITDRPLYRELAKQAISRTLADLQAAHRSEAANRAKTVNAKTHDTPESKLEAEYRAARRSFTARAHGVNLDLGTALLKNLANVDPANMDVARFFAYGVLGSPSLDFLGAGPHTVATIVANGIRLVVSDHRETTIPRLKGGGRGKTKVVYSDIEDPAKWLWNFVAGAKTAGELYGRVLVVFASQHYANQIVLAKSKRRDSVLPASHKDTARKAFIRVTKSALPESHIQLQRAIEREARNHLDRIRELSDPQHNNDSEKETSKG
jgi:ParB/RepB/Spo0J family partition protein